MRKITLDITSAENNAAALADAINTYGKAFFDSASADGYGVTCAIGGQTAAVFQIADYLPILWTGDSGVYTIRDSLNYNRYKEIWFFDGAIFLPVATSDGSVDYRRGCIITKDKSGTTAIIFLHGSVSGLEITTAASNGDPVACLGAIRAFSGLIYYNHYRSILTGASIQKTFAVPVWTAESYTEDVLAVVAMISTENYAPFQIIINDVNYYAVLSDSFIIRSD